MIIPVPLDKPLFTFRGNMGDPNFGPELRAEIQGFGRVAPENSSIFPDEMTHACNSVVAEAMMLSYWDCERDTSDWSAADWPHDHTAACNHAPRRFPQAIRIVETARIFFELDEIDKSVWTRLKHSSCKSREAIIHLVPLLLSLSRLPRQDLEQCARAPLPVKLHRKGLNYRINKADTTIANFPDIVESFDILSPYLVGQSYVKSCVEEVLLISECGWSIFFDVVDATDPSDVSLCSLRMQPGVPSIEDASKDRVIKEKILDGPRHLSFPFENATIMERVRNSDSSVRFFPGISTAERETSLIGFRDNDAFLATQTFNWTFKGREGRTHILGFRRMLNLCNNAIWMPACTCVNTTNMLHRARLEARKLFAIKSTTVESSPITDLPDPFLPGSEFAMRLSWADRDSCAQAGVEEGAWILSVSENPAARWLGMDGMGRREYYHFDVDSDIIMRDSGSCMQHACERFSNPPRPTGPRYVLL